MGVFIDLNSLKISKSEHIDLLERVMCYVHDLEGALCNSRAYGNKFNFPANYSENKKVKERVKHKYISAYRSNKISFVSPRLCKSKLQNIFIWFAIFYIIHLCFTLYCDLIYF